MAVGVGVGVAVLLGVGVGVWLGTAVNVGVIDGVDVTGDVLMAEIGGATVVALRQAAAKMSNVHVIIPLVEINFARSQLIICPF